MPERGVLAREDEPPQVDVSSFYVSSDQLSSCEEPGTSIARVVSEVSSKEWMISCNAMLYIRRLVRFHKDAFESHAEPALHSILQQMRNLRSVVSKSALLCATEIIDGYDTSKILKDEDSIQRCFCNLIEMNSSGKKFVAVEARKALAALSTNLSLTLVNLSLENVDNPNASFRSVLMQNLNDSLPGESFGTICEVSWIWVIMKYMVQVISRARARGQSGNGN